MHDYRSLEHKPSSSMVTRQADRRQRDKPKEPRADPNPLILWSVLLGSLVLLLGLDYLLNRPEMSTKMVLIQLLGAEAAAIRAWPVASIIWWRIVLPLLLLYGTVVWPITRWKMVQQNCYDGTVYRCRKHPGRCFDCKAFAAIDKAFIPLERAMLYFHRLLKRSR